MPGLRDAIKSGDEAYLDRYKILIYSYPGAGKTTLAAQFPRPFIIETDTDGQGVLRNLPPGIRSEVRFYASQDWATIVRTVRSLSKDKELLSEFDTIVLDTVSSLQDIERGEQLAGDPLTADKWMFNEHIFTVNNFKVDLLVDEIIKLGKNVVLTAHLAEDTIVTDKTSKKILRPGLSPGLTRTIAASMEAVFFLEFNGVNRILRLQGGSDVLCKSRFKLQGASTMVDPTFQKLAPIFNSLLKPKTKETT
jgi:hypothetical protein